MTKTLSNLQRDLLGRIQTTLDGLGCKYKITTPDGEVIATQKAGRVLMRQRSVFPLGEQRRYYRPLVENLAEGEYAEIPFDKYTPVNLQSGITGFCSRLWGKGNFTTTVDRKRGVVGVLRSGGL